MLLEIENNLKISVFHLRNFISKTNNVRNFKRHRNGAMYDPKTLKKSPKKKVIKINLRYHIYLVV